MRAGLPCFLLAVVLLLGAACDTSPKSSQSTDVASEVTSDVAADSPAEDLLDNGADTAVSDTVNDGRTDGAADGVGDMDADTAPDESDVAVVVVEPGDPGTADVRFDVDTTARRRPISPYIYGTNAVSFSEVVGGDLMTLGRFGGNRLTAYNWETNASNAGEDWLNQNDDYLGGGDTPGEAARGRTQSANDVGAAMLVTVPILDYVAADKDGGGDVQGSANYLTTRFCANLSTSPGTPDTTPDTADGSVYQDAFVALMEAAFPQAHNGGPELYYLLDNEPDLWSSTHPRIHPDAVTYAELLARSLDYAAMLKRVAPRATVFGPALGGWWAYWDLSGAPDAGGRDFIDFYLQGFRDAEQQGGTRLLDVLDLHWYPEIRPGGGTRITEADASPAVAAARVQAPRSLWDPSYVEESWITQCCWSGGLALIPELRSRIDTNYPGTRLSFSEYTYGGGEHISGAVAQAAVLGTFGREGVWAAMLWPLASNYPYILGGFELYRNYDGQGGRFGETSVSANSSDVAVAEAFASVRGDGTVVLVVVNRSLESQVAGVAVRHTGQLSVAEVYQVVEGQSSPVQAADVASVATNAFSLTLPAMSAATLVLR